MIKSNKKEKVFYSLIVGGGRKLHDNFIKPFQTCRFIGSFITANFADIFISLGIILT